MLVNVYKHEKVLEERKFFWNYESALRYVKHICPKKFGYGEYHFIIIAR